MAEGDWDNYDSGPYCKHWDDPGNCEQCDAEKAAPAINAVLDALTKDVEGLAHYSEMLGPVYGAMKPHRMAIHASVLALITKHRPGDGK